jgi:multisubunit Na+/H+ antiporter MnhE subunit
VLFGMFGAYLIFVWSYPPARVQALIIIGVNLLINIALGGFTLPQIVAGLIVGAGATYLFRRYDDSSDSKARTPYLIIAAVVVGLILIAIVRTLL